LIATTKSEILEINLDNMSA